MNTASIVMILFFLVIAYGALHDIAVRTIPNLVCLAVLLLACTRISSTGHVAATAFFFLSTLLMLLIVWRLGILGGGDVKLWSSATLFLPPTWPVELRTFALVVLCGGVIAIGYISLHAISKVRGLRLSPVARPRSLLFWRRAFRSERWRIHRGGSMPYAAAISAGFLWSLWPALQA